MTDIPAADPPTPTRPPAEAPPENACDAHVHILGDDHPPSPGRVEDPAPVGDLDAWLDLLRAHLAALGTPRVVIVHSIVYGGDNTVTFRAVRRMGEIARGIALVRAEVSETELDVLAHARCKGVRLNYVHGGLLDWAGAKALAPRLAARGMHLQILLHADRHMDEIAGDVRALPCPLVIDHVGWPAEMGAGPDAPGFRTLRGLLADGHAYAKLSAPYRLGADATAHVRALVDASPERCLWGSDWPHIMLGGAPRPEAGALLDAFHGQVPDAAHRRAILVDNPARLYGF